MDSKFVAIYEKLKIKLYSYVLYKVRSSAVAEDIASEVFLRFFKELKKTPEIYEYAQAWIYRTAYNLIIDHVRSAHYKKGHTVSELEARKSNQNDDENAEFDITDTQIKNYLDKEIKDEQIMLVHKGIDDLKTVEREIIELRIFQELPFNEISVVLEIAEGAAKMRFKRALNKLKYVVENKQDVSKKS